MLFAKDHNLTTIILTTQSPDSTEVDLIYILHLGIFLGSFLKLLLLVEFHAFSSWFYFLKKLVSQSKLGREGGTLSCISTTCCSYIRFSIFFLSYIVLELIVCLPSLSFKYHSSEGRDHISLILEFSKGLNFITVPRRHLW